MPQSTPVEYCVEITLPTLRSSYIFHTSFFIDTPGVFPNINFDLGEKKLKEQLVKEFGDVSIVVVDYNVGA